MSDGLASGNASRVCSVSAATAIKKEYSLVERITVSVPPPASSSPSGNPEDGLRDTAVLTQVRKIMAEIRARKGLPVTAEDSSSDETTNDPPAEGRS
jgi:hypothetical protein